MRGSRMENPPAQAKAFSGILSIADHPGATSIPAPARFPMLITKY